ncbi:hypothetical protein EYF80_062311 [Liparis tanakae]|uniref:Uncharacterized protein n=1 Tax=Liparis tanakae TaxID=230148 RepID=A0A4Z2EFP7_9TELE|nr:hypothetical protein EYF80_062311 [Liparis tanakae]
MLDGQTAGRAREREEAVQQRGRLGGEAGGRRPPDGKLSNSFHRPPEDRSATREEPAPREPPGALQQKPRRRDREGANQLASHALHPAPDCRRPIPVTAGLEGPITARSSSSVKDPHHNPAP